MASQNLVIKSLSNGLPPAHCHANAWTNVDYCQLNAQEQTSINFEMKYKKTSQKHNKMHFKMLSAKYWPFQVAQASVFQLKNSGKYEPQNSRSSLLKYSVWNEGMDK